MQAPEVDNKFPAVKILITTFALALGVGVTFLHLNDLTKESVLDEGIDMLCACIGLAGAGVIGCGLKSHPARLLGSKIRLHFTLYILTYSLNSIATLMFCDKSFKERTP